MAKSKRKQKASANGKGHGTANHLLGNAKVMAGAIVNTGKDIGAEKILGLAEGVRALSRSAAPQVREYAALGADGLEGLAGYVTETDFEQMMDDAAVFARRHPWAVVGVGLAGGLIASQVLRVSLAGRNGTAHFAPRKARARKKASVQARAARRAGNNGRAHVGG